jgi:hypothetical protein
VTGVRQLPGGAHLAYTVVQEAWYAFALDPAERTEIGVMAQVPREGVCWEFAVVQTGPGEQVRLRLHPDATAAYTEIPEFFLVLDEQRFTTLDEVRTLLDKLGEADETERERR